MGQWELVLPGAEAVAGAGARNTSRGQRRREATIRTHVHFCNINGKPPQQSAKEQAVTLSLSVWAEIIEGGGAGQKPRWKTARLPGWKEGSGLELR